MNLQTIVIIIKICVKTFVLGDFELVRIKILACRLRCLYVMWTSIPCHTLKHTIYPISCL